MRYNQLKTLIDTLERENPGCEFIFPVGLTSISPNALVAVIRAQNGDIACLIMGRATDAYDMPVMEVDPNTPPSRIEL